MRGRPKLFTSYEADAAIFPTGMQRWLAATGVLVMILMPFDIPLISGPVPESWPLLSDIPVLKNGLPFVRFLGDGNWIRPMTEVLIFAVAALGLNILTGMGGQVSLGHAFFMGAGACTAAVLGGATDSRFWGLGLPIWIWLPAAGVVAALIGIIVSPTARPMPIIRAEKMPGLAVSSTTRVSVCQGVAPSAREPRVRLFGTLNTASSAIE